MITVEYPSLYLVNAYIPNSGDGLKRLDYRIQQWDGHLAEYLQHLAKTKPVILTGDLNCSHQEIDIHAPKRNLRSAGFTQVCPQDPWPLQVTHCILKTKGALAQLRSPID